MAVWNTPVEGGRGLPALCIRAKRADSRGFLSAGLHCGIGWFRNAERAALGKFSKPLYRDRPFGALAQTARPLPVEHRRRQMTLTGKKWLALPGMNEGLDSLVPQKLNPLIVGGAPLFADERIGQPRMGGKNGRGAKTASRPGVRKSWARWCWPTGRWTTLIHRPWPWPPSRGCA